MDSIYKRLSRRHVTGAGVHVKNERFRLHEIMMTMGGGDLMPAAPRAVTGLVAILIATACIARLQYTPKLRSPISYGMHLQTNRIARRLFTACSGA